MTIISILLLFHLLISFIIHINPFSDCLYYLEASQLIYKVNRLIGFSVMGISIKRHFRVICKIIFFVNRILLYVYTDIFYMYSLFGIFHVTLFQYSGLCQPSWQRFWQIWLFWSQVDVPRRHFLLCTAVFDHYFFDWKDSYYSKMQVNLTQYRGTVWIFNSLHFVFNLKHKSLSSI